MSCIFCKNSSFSSILVTSYRDFHILCFVFVRFVLFSRANIQKMDETAIVHFVHYSFRIRLPNNQINKVEGEEEDVAGYDADGVQTDWLDTGAGKGGDMVEGGV